MPFIVEETRTPGPEGSMKGRCFAIIDHGTHPHEYQGKLTGKDVREVAVGWEVFPENDEGEIVRRSDGQPYTVWHRYNISFDVRARLRIDLEAWRGRAFTAEEMKGFDMERLLGAPARLQIANNEAGYSKVKALGSLTPSEIKAFNADFPPESKPVLWSVADGPNDLFDTFADWRKDLIRECYEWNDGAQQPQTQTAVAANDDGDEEIPF